jgi:outer membrane biosynthesis protein TonB
MRWKFWQAEEEARPVASEEVAAPRPDPVPEPAPEPVDEPAPEPVDEPAPEPVDEPPAEPAEPEPEPEPVVPAQVTLTIDEAKGVIKEAGGDVIQVGFLASAYRRNLEEDPESRETIASRKRLCELVEKRLKDRGLLASDGILELRD